MTIKAKLLAHCLDYVERRIKTAKDAIAEAQSSANAETKSSAGDKYETGRAMMQIEIEKNTAQLNEALKLKKMLLQINPTESTSIIQPGSVVITNKDKFYVAISAGKCTVDNVEYTTLSPASPLGIKLMRLESGAEFEFRSNRYCVERVI